MPSLLWRWWTAAKVLSTAVTVALPVQGTVRLSILPRQTRLNFLPLNFLLFTTLLLTPLQGSQGEPVGDGEEEEREGPPLGHPSPLILPLIIVLTESETKQQQRLISCGFTVCAYYAYWKDHYAGWTTCTHCSQPLTLQLVGRDLSLLFKHSTGYIRMNHSFHNTSKNALKQHDSKRSTFLIGYNSLTQ